MKENRHIEYVQRNLEKGLLAFINDKRRHKNVLLLEGARQVGKTCLVHHVLAQLNRPYVAINLERDRLFQNKIDQCFDFSDFHELLIDETDFADEANMILFIDEAQESMRLGSFVRFMKEEWEDVTVILTGSTLHRLFRPNIRFPVGRVQRLVLSPFSFSEYLLATGQKQLHNAIQPSSKPISARRHEKLLAAYNNFLAVGGLPDIVLNQHERSVEHMHASMLADYQEDFRRILGEETVFIAEACLKAVANHLGNPSKNTSVIPNASGSVSSKISAVFSRLEAWRFLLCSKQLSPSPEKSHNYLPKRYLFDTGLARHLREASVPSIQVTDTLDPDSRKPLGGILENQVAIDLTQQLSELHGWKKSSCGTEIDFIIPAKRRSIPVECKAALSIGKRHLKGLADYLNIYNQSLGYCISFAPQQIFDITPGKQIVNLPAYRTEFLSTLNE